jgi:hypothetical protein
MGKMENFRLVMLNRFLTCYHHLPPWELLLTTLHDAQQLQMGSDFRSDHIIWYTWAALGLSKAALGSVFPIPRIVACGVWGVGPFSLILQGGCLSVVWGFVSYLLQLYGLTSWGCTIPLRGGGFNGESTPLAWKAAFWGVCNTGGGVGGIYWVCPARGLLIPAVCKSLLHWTLVLMFCLHTGWPPL